MLHTSSHMSDHDGGYSLDQLLQWCKDDHLIDGYDKSDESVVIFLNGQGRELNLTDATNFLKSIFTSTHRRNGTSASDGDVLA